MWWGKNERVERRVEREGRENERHTHRQMIGKDPH